MNIFIPLSQLKPGQWGIVDRFLEGTGIKLQLRLLEIGLIPGTVVQFVRQAPNNGPIQIRVGESFLGLRTKDAKLLQVRLT